MICVVVGPSPGAQHNDGDITPVSGSTPLGSKKSSGGGGFLRSLLCCWRGGRGKGPPGGNGTNSIDGRASPPLLVMSDHSPRPLLPPVRHQDMHKKCMVIDLDETLVHSSFKVSTFCLLFFLYSVLTINVFICLSFSCGLIENLLKICCEY